MEPPEKKIKMENLQESSQTSIVQLNDDCLEELMELDKVCPRFRSVADGYFYRKKKVLKIDARLHNDLQIADWAERVGPFLSTLQIFDNLDRFTEVETLKPLWINCTNLKHLIIQKTNIRTHLTLLKNVFKTLNQVNLINCKLTAKIGDCLKMASNLEFLFMEGKCRILVKFLPELKDKIKRLDLRGWRNVFQGPYFADFCKDNQKLERLEFSFTPNTPESVMFMKHLNELKTLRTLHIEHPEYGPETTILQGFATLTHLILESSICTRPRGITNLNGFIDSIKDSLRRLEITGGSTEEFHKILGRFTNLQHFKTQYTRDEHLVNINWNCRKTLEHLQIIDSYSVTDAGLLQLVKDCSNLKSLDVRTCWRISNNLIIGLLPFVKKRSHPMKIKVSGTNITRSIEKKLRRHGNHKIQLDWN